MCLFAVYFEGDYNFLAQPANLSVSLGSEAVKPYLRQSKV